MPHHHYEQPLRHKFWFIYGQRLHRFMTRRAVNAFMRPSDIISHRPSLFGYHEPHLEQLIGHEATNHGDFLMDIGANIGLVSCLTGGHFKKVIAVEPNQIVCNILRSNLALNLPEGQFEIHEIGLGHEDGTAELTVPRTNFGGGFVADQNPQLSDQGAENLATNFSDRADHFTTMITIKEAQKWVGDVFADLSSNGLKHGVIKIDVEGYEGLIFDTILAQLPPDMTVVVIMENWFKNFPTSSFASDHHKLDFYTFVKQRRWLKSLPFKILGLSSLYRFAQVPLTDQTRNPHDVICYVTPKRQARES